MAHMFRVNPVPPVVTQPGLTCWAAAALSWLIAKGRQEFFAQFGIKTANDLVELFKPFTVSGGALDLQQGLEPLADFLDLKFRKYQPGKLLTGSEVHSLLVNKGHLWMLIAGGQLLPNPIAHAVVVYKIDDWWTSGATVGAMDPFPGIGGPNVGGLIDRPLSVYRSASLLALGWSTSTGYEPYQM